MPLHDDVLLRQLTTFVRELAAQVTDGEPDHDRVRAEVAQRVGLGPAAAVRLGATATLSFLTTPDGLDHGRAVLLGLGVAVEAEATGGDAEPLRAVSRALLAAGLPGLDAERRRSATALARELGVSVGSG